jgi:hypothetical protein
MSLKTVSAWCRYNRSTHAPHCSYPVPQRSCSAVRIARATLCSTRPTARGVVRRRTASVRGSRPLPHHNTRPNRQPKECRPSVTAGVVTDVTFFAPHVIRKSRGVAVFHPLCVRRRRARHGWRREQRGGRSRAAPCHDTCSAPLHTGPPRCHVRMFHPVLRRLPPPSSLRARQPEQTPLACVQHTHTHAPPAHETRRRHTIAPWLALTRACSFTHPHTHTHAQHTHHTYREHIDQLAFH